MSYELEDNPFIPKTAIIEHILSETIDVKTFVLKPRNWTIDFTPGQFILVLVPGIGEAPFAIASSPSLKTRIEITVRRVGNVTKALHKLSEKSIIGIRGPYGNGFPINELVGNNIITIAGGTGLIGVSSLLWHIYENRELYGEVYLLYGSRTPRDILRRKDLGIWSRNIKILLSVDKTNGEEWSGYVGFVTDLLDKIDVFKNNTKYVLCGPPIMMKVAYYKLVKRGISPSSIYVSLERHMKCGIGKCGRCMLSNGLFVCKDGPVFRCDQIPEREIQ